MTSKEQFKELYNTLYLGGGNMPDDLKELLKSQLSTLQVIVERELIEAEQKGMTDAYASMSVTVDSKGEYYVEDECSTKHEDGGDEGFNAWSVEFNN